tara:strand:- start:341 stop:625 length:285 start_codon:yes stop_codon:yes gene_type:complete
MDTVKTISVDVAQQLEGQALNSVVSGFSFAAAIAWMDVVRVLVSTVSNSSKQTPQALTITAVMTTLLSILVFMITSRVSKRVVKPQAPVYTVGR